MTEAAGLHHAACSLVPLASCHAAGLAQVAQAGDLFKNPYLFIPAPHETATYVARALAGQAAGRELPFAVVANDAAASVLGTTRFQFINAANKRAQIGSTWLACAVQGNAVNTVAKYLLLQFGFEALGLQRIEFAVHPGNALSRAALAKLGAQYEGTLRNYQQLRGQAVDMCVYSVVAADWAALAPAILQRIEAKMKLFRMQGGPHHAFN